MLSFSLIYFKFASIFSYIIYRIAAYYFLGDFKEEKESVMQIAGLLKKDDKCPQKWAWFITVIALTVGFFTPVRFWGLTQLAYFVAIVFLFFLYRRNTSVDYSQNKDVVIVAGLLVISFIVIAIASPYGFKNAFKLILPLGAIVIMYQLMEAEEYEPVSQFFYILFSVVLIVMLILYLANPELFRYLGGYEHDGAPAPGLFGLPDKNETALLVFLYFCFSVRKKYVFGTAYGLVYPFVYFGRQYIIMLAISVLIIGILFIYSRKKELTSIHIPAWALFLSLAIMTALVAGVSWAWTEYVVPTGVGQYKTTLNDNSNAMRSWANRYALERASSEMPGFLIYGFDDELFEQFGINRDLSADNMNPKSTYYVNGMFRLVQPDSEVINTLVKEGILFTLSYYALICILLSHMIKRHEDLYLIIPFFIGSMVVNGMLNGGFLVMLFFVLAVQPRSLTDNWIMKRIQVNHPLK